MRIAVSTKRPAMWQKAEFGIFHPPGSPLGSNASSLHAKLEDNAYRLELEDGRLIWHGRKDGAPIRFTNEPETTAKKRLIVRALGLLPIESQL